MAFILVGLFFLLNGRMLKTAGQQDVLYIADTLTMAPYRTFWTSHFQPALTDNNINYQILSCTNDIWARDYMPVKVSSGNWVKFIYAPDYLAGSASDRSSWSNGYDLATRQVGISPVARSNLLVDGGNVVMRAGKAIMVDKVIAENQGVDASLTRTDIENALKSALGVTNLILIPGDPVDDIGHSDGIVRFINDSAVLVNAYDKAQETGGGAWVTTLHNKLRAAGLGIELLSYNPYNNADETSAVGIYINYVRVGDVIFLPKYDRAEDSAALAQIQRVFGSGVTVVQVKSNAIARAQGILNCITWEADRNPITSFIECPRQAEIDAVFGIGLPSDTKSFY